MKRNHTLPLIHRILIIKDEKKTRCGLKLTDKEKRRKENQRITSRVAANDIFIIPVGKQEHWSAEDSRSEENKQSQRDDNQRFMTFLVQLSVDSSKRPLSFSAIRVLVTLESMTLRVRKAQFQVNLSCCEKSFESAYLLRC